MKDSKKQVSAPGKGKGDKKSKKANVSTQQTGTQSSTNGNGGGDVPKLWDDDRFAHLINNPRYHGIPKSKKKVKIDSRFKAMFEDDRFNQKATMDKYGRKVKKTDSDMLRKFYQLESDDEGNEEETAREREREERAMEGRAGSSESESELTEGLQLTKEEKQAKLSGKVKNQLKAMDVDFARGEGALGSDSSSDDESDGGEGEEEEVFIEHVWGELDADAERTEESTRRLAVCHMDWDRIRAVDVMVLLSSFLPPGSAIKSVTIYPSEYGKQRMQEEEKRGPQELTARKIEHSDEEEEDEEVQKERLREYQLNRLKYYYAVVECDSVGTADKIYKECDGIEYESTANKLDLRFIPDDMEFDDQPKDQCNELPEVGKYVPRIFATTAQHQTKVELTWDENDPDRKEFNEKLRDGKWADMPETELKKYVVCSSSDEEGEDEDGRKDNGKSKRPVVRIRPPGSGSEEDDDDDDDEAGSDSDGAPKGRRKEDMIAKYRALLNDIKEQEKAGEEDKVGMEFSWQVNGEDKEAANDESEEESDSKRVKDDVNPFEKILLKKTEKNRRRKELKKRRKRGELGEDGEANEDETSDDDTPYGVDLNDPFFASAFDEKEFDVGNKKKKSKQKDREAIKQAKEEEEREAEESARRRAELELMLDDGEDNRAHFNLKAIQESEIDLRTVSKSKRRHLLKKSRREIEEQRNSKVAADDFEVNTEDPRFSAIYSQPDYNIDPTNPAFKKTKAMERLIETKLRKRQLAENDVREENGRVEQQQGAAKVARKDVSTTLLVKSIKRKMGKTT
uniref:Uncharacterized protein n=1 Tax=Anopheles epiroticus TaxID=199890 RepID=A0A182P5R5_9DIPT